MTVFALLVATLLAAQSRGSSFLAGDGATLAYEEGGAGEPVILLAGGPGFTPTYMRPIGERLARSFQYALLHQRGTGGSSRAAAAPGAITLARAVDDVDALRRALRLERVILIGHSWGGMLAMSYAAMHPERVRALVLIGSGGPTLDYMRQYDRNTQARLTGEDRRNAAVWVERQKNGMDARSVAVGVLKAEMPASFHDRSKARLLTDPLGDDAFAPEVFERMIADLRARYDLRPQLKTLRVPVLLVQGTSDPIATADALKRALPSAQLEFLENAGHYPWLEQPEPFYRLVEDFLLLLTQALPPR